MYLGIQGVYVELYGVLLLCDYFLLTVVSIFFLWSEHIYLSPYRMDDHDRVSQASSVATISYFPVVKFCFQITRLPSLYAWVT